MKKNKNFYGQGISSIEGEDWKFNKNISDNFDEHVRQSIPLYDEIQKYICSLSQWFIKNDSVIYDLGCSTGETANNLFNKYNYKKFTYRGYDISRDMVDLANKKNYKYKNRAIFKVADINKIIFKKNTDLFLSVLTFPFLNSEKRLNLYKKIYKSLKYSGALIFVDKIRTSNSNFEDMFNQVYIDFKLDKKLNHLQIFNKAKSLRSSMQIFELSEINDFLKDSGFKKTEVFFRWYNFVGVIAIK